MSTKLISYWIAIHHNCYILKTLTSLVSMQLQGTVSCDLYRVLPRKNHKFQTSVWKWCVLGIILALKKVSLYCCFRLILRVQCCRCQLLFYWTMGLKMSANIESFQCSHFPIMGAGVTKFPSWGQQSKIIWRDKAFLLNEHHWNRCVSKYPCSKLK